MIDARRQPASCCSGPQVALRRERGAVWAWTLALPLLLVGCGGATPPLATGQVAASGASAAAARQTAAQLKVAGAKGDAEAQGQRWGPASSRFHAAMRTAKQPSVCAALKTRRDRAAGHYASQLLRGLEDRLTAPSAREIFAQAAGLARAAWVPLPERHRAEALMARAGAQLWAASSAADPSARLAQVQGAAAWALQLPADDPTVRAWRAESLRLATHHDALRSARSALPFAGWLQNRLVRELGGVAHPSARRWLAEMVRASSLRFEVRLEGPCRAQGDAAAAALASPFGVRVPVTLQMQSCGDQRAATSSLGAYRVFVADVRIRPPNANVIRVHLGLGAKPTAAASALDLQLAGAAAARIRAAAAPIRRAQATPLIARARVATNPLQAEELWLHALAWRGALPEDGVAFLRAHVGLTLAQAIAAQSTRWPRARLLLRLPTRPYPAGKPHDCGLKADARRPPNPTAAPSQPAHASAVDRGD